MCVVAVVVRFGMVVVPVLSWGWRWRWSCRVHQVSCTTTIFKTDDHHHHHHHHHHHRHLAGDVGGGGRRRVRQSCVLHASLCCSAAGHHHVVLLAPRTVTKLRALDEMIDNLRGTRYHRYRTLYCNKSFLPGICCTDSTQNLPPQVSS